MLESCMLDLILVMINLVRNLNLQLSIFPTASPLASPPSGVGLLEPAPAPDGVVSQRPAGRELGEAKPDEARAKREADAEEATDGQGRGAAGAHFWIANSQIYRFLRPFFGSP